MTVDVAITAGVITQTITDVGNPNVKGQIILANLEQQVKKYKTYTQALQKV